MEQHLRSAHLFLVEVERKQMSGPFSGARVELQQQSPVGRRARPQLPPRCNVVAGLVSGIALRGPFSPWACGFAGGAVARSAAAAVGCRHPKVGPAWAPCGPAALVTDLFVINK